MDSILFITAILLIHLQRSHQLTFVIICDIRDSSLSPQKTSAFSLHMSKIFAIKTLYPLASLGIVKILSFTVIFFMFNVLDLGMDFLPKYLVKWCYEFTKDLRNPEILFRITFSLDITIFIIVNNLWRILSTITNLWLTNSSSFFKVLHLNRIRTMELTQT